MSASETSPAPYDVQAPFHVIRFDNPTEVAKALGGILLALPCRYEALIHALSSFAILDMSDTEAEQFESGLRAWQTAEGCIDPRIDDLRERLLLKEIRRVHAPQWRCSRQSCAAPDIREWERRTVLGAPWHSCVVSEGVDLAELLRPAFETNALVRVIDPALGGVGSRETLQRKARRRLFELVGQARCRRLEVFTEAKSRFPGNPAACSTTTSSAPPKPPADSNRGGPEILSQATEQLLEDLGQSLPAAATAPHVTWTMYDRKRCQHMHDRYVAFFPSETDPTPRVSFALTIGYGLLSLGEHDEKRITVAARISHVAFGQEWTVLTKKCEELETSSREWCRTVQWPPEQPSGSER